MSEGLIIDFRAVLAGIANVFLSAVVAVERANLQPTLSI
jgi:hypothetical protein